jgi:hypothetical protein
MACYLQHLVQIEDNLKGRSGNCIRDRPAGNAMTDEKLHTMSENQLRALYNSAPDYLKALLDRKRMMEQGIVWELSIPERAARRTY